MMKVMTIVANTEQKISRINIFKVLYSSLKSSKILILENKSPYGILQGSQYHKQSYRHLKWRMVGSHKVAGSSNSKNL